MYAQCATWETQENAAAWLVHKTKLQLLNERVKARVEKEHGKELDAFADSIVEFAKQSNQSDDALDKKRETLTEQWEKLFE